MSRLIRNLVSILVCTVLIVASCVTFCGTSVQFYLSDEEVKTGRLFDIDLSAQGTDDVAAFSVDIAFDGSALEYRDFSLNVDGLQAEVNATEKGMIKAVFLCEDSLDFSSDTEIATFSFKALCSGDYQVELSVSDAIDSNYNDIKVQSQWGTVSVVSAPGSDNKSKVRTTDISSIAEEETAETNKNIKESSEKTELNGNNDNRSTVFFVLMAILTLLCIVAFVFYKVGVGVQQRKEGKE